MEEGLGFLGTMVLASPPILGAPGPSNDGHVAALGSPPLLPREWTHGATKYLVELVKERIESYGTAVFKKQHWERIWEHVIKDHPSEARRTWTQVRDKWDKLKRHYHKEKKLHNVTGDNAGSQWIWFNMIDEIFSGTAKADGVPGDMNNGRPVGVDEHPSSQLEEDLQQVSEEERESPRSRASNFPGVRGQPVKRRKMASDMAASLDRFCESTRRIEELKLKTAIKLHEDNMKLELEMFKLTHASQEKMTTLEGVGD